MARRPSTAITEVPAAAPTAVTNAHAADVVSELSRTRAKPKPINQPHSPAMRMAMNAIARAPVGGSADKAVRPGMGAPAPEDGVTERDTAEIVDCPLVRTLVVLPTYNELENIGEVLDLLRARVPSVHILVVDDSSPDGTADAAEKKGAELGQVTVERRPGKSGLGSAYRFGFARGLADGFDVIVEMDSDLSHDPAALPALLAAVEQGAHLAIGSRYVPGGQIPDWSWHRRLLSRWGNRYASMVLGLSVRDATSGYRAYRADMLRRLDLSTVRADGYAFQIEMAYLVVTEGGRVVEVPISFVDRLRGLSKMSGRIVIEALGLVTWWGFRDRILRRRHRKER
jgi:dolichol-phosphate mannosyltransferase